MAVRAVVFDVGNVLFRWERAALFSKLIPDSEALRHFLEHVLPLEWHAQHDAGRPIGEMLDERIALFPQHADVIGVYLSRWNEMVPGPVPGMLELAGELHQAGVPLYGITNFGADTWDVFRPTAPVFDLFNDIVVSGVEKMVKPDPAIYQLARSRFGLAAGEGIFVDDVFANVEAARANGFVGWHFVGDAGAFRRELTRLELLPG